MMKAMLEDGLRSEKGAVPTGKRKLWKKFEKNKKTLKKLLTKRDFCGKINSVAEVITSDDG